LELLWILDLGRLELSFAPFEFNPINSVNLFGFNISRAPRSDASTVQRSFSPTSADWLAGRDLDYQGAVMTNAYEQVVWVYRAINVLAEQIANIPFLFSTGERGRENLITSGPLLDFYARPHPQINRFQYWELRLIWLMLRGECFRIPIYEDALIPGPDPNRIGRGETGTRRKLKRILILDPAHFYHLVEDHKLVGWRYTGLGPRAPLASQVFLPEEVWFEKLPNPFDFWRGLPPLYAAATAARTDFAASAFMRGIIENNADRGVIVRTEKPMAPEQEEQVFAALRARKRRAGMADKPVLLSGVTEVIKPELSSGDLQFLENRKFSRAEICAAFGVPEEILTATDHAKYDVMQGARQNFIENRVAPLCGRLEAEEDVVVKAIEPKAVGWFDLDSLPIMQQARRNRLVTAKTGFDMGVPFNELNRLLDLGFKRLPWGDAGYLAGNLQKVGESPTKDSPLSTVRGPLSEADPIDRALSFLERTVPAEPSAPEPESGAPLKSEARRLRRFFFEQRGRVLKRLAEARRSADSPVRALELDVVLDAAGEREKLRSMLASLDSPKAEELNQTHLNALRNSLADGMEQGETSEPLAARVRAVYNRQSHH